MNEWEMETYFGGAKYYEQLEPNPSPTSLVDEINGVYDPFRIDPETGRQANPMAQDAWYQKSYQRLGRGIVERMTSQVWLMKLKLHEGTIAMPTEEKEECSLQMSY